MNPAYKIETDRISRGEKPNYAVCTESLGMPFVTAETAIQWHNELLRQDVVAPIYDLTEYDWETNPLGIRLLQVNDLYPLN